MYLDKIVAYKQEEIKSLKKIDSIRSKNVIDAVASLKAKPFITEIKKASPSMGDINTKVDIVTQARLYESGGAGAISVLTDKKYFKGDIAFLTEISDAVNLPVLCKDFILSEIQIENAYASGADIVLLIAAILNEDELKVLSKKASELGIKVLFELHSIDEFKKISNLEPELVGVNSRDLKSFEIKKDAAMKTISQLKGDFLRIAESGINNKEDIKKFKDSGADAFLIGTSLMTADDPVEKINEFYSALR